MLAQIAQESDPAFEVAFYGTVALILFAAWRVFCWLKTPPSTPDPWDDKVAAEMDAEDAPALCHHCLEPHDDRAHFCARCGVAVGQYTNILPFDYLFSVGDALRVGTRGEFKRTPFTVVGYFLFALAEYSLFAPVYWVVLAFKLLGSDKPAPPSNPTPPASTSPNGI